MFKYINNNQKKDIFLIHGWATDYKIFENLKIPYNYILIDSKNPYKIPDAINSYCKQNHIKTINILGWSMGSFVAIDFIKTYHEIIDVKDLILMSVCKNYDQKNIKNIRKFLAKNKNLYLANFYKKCFFSATAFEFEFDYYLNSLTTDELNIGLDYLEKASLDMTFLETLKHTNITIINAENDEIINPSTILSKTSKSKNIKIQILKNHGHAFFLE